jgi:hypothetical protein
MGLAYQSLAAEASFGGERERKTPPSLGSRCSGAIELDWGVEIALMAAAKAGVAAISNRPTRMLSTVTGGAARRAPAGRLEQGQAFFRAQ